MASNTTISLFFLVFRAFLKKKEEKKGISMQCFTLVLLS